MYYKNKKNAEELQVVVGVTNGPRPENIETAAKHFNSKFQMILYIAKRARQLNKGMPAKIDVDKSFGYKSTVIALLEAMQGIVVDENGEIVLNYQCPPVHTYLHGANNGTKRVRR